MPSKAKLQRIKELRAERELIKQDIVSMTIMDDEGMGGGDDVLCKMEEKLKQIDLELEELTKPSFFRRFFCTT